MCVGGGGGRCVWGGGGGGESGRVERYGNTGDGERNV